MNNYEAKRVEAINEITAILRRNEMIGIVIVGDIDGASSKTALAAPWNAVIELAGGQGFLDNTASPERMTRTAQVMKHLRGIVVAWMKETEPACAVLSKWIKAHLPEVEAILGRPNVGTETEGGGLIAVEGAQPMATVNWKCATCGCTDTSPCVTDGKPCHWITPNLCSVCSNFNKEIA